MYNSVGLENTSREPKEIGTLGKGLDWILTFLLNLVILTYLSPTHNINQVHWRTGLISFMPYITLFKEVNEFYILIDSILFISITEHFSGSSKLRQKHYSFLYNFVCLCTNQTIKQFTTKQVFGNQHTRPTLTEQSGNLV